MSQEQKEIVRARFSKNESYADAVLIVMFVEVVPACAGNDGLLGLLFELASSKQYSREEKAYFIHMVKTNAAILTR